jgi:hypothetical protein
VDEMKRIYRGFKTECPTGLITEEAFQGIYQKFFPHGGLFNKIVVQQFRKNYSSMSHYINR